MQLVDIVLHVDKSLGLLIQQYGAWVYVLLFAIVFAETGLVVLPFLPGDTLLFIAGAMCATGQMDAWLLIVLPLGARAGDLFGFGSLLGLLLAVPAASCIKTFADAWQESFQPEAPQQQAALRPEPE